MNNFFITHPDLILLGFVHSQPEKGPLTSFDLHSLWTYAKLNPALISVVYFPTDRRYEAFSLTKLAMKELAACKKTGLHQHPNAVTKLCMDAPHAVGDETRDIILIDYRLSE